MGLSLGQHRLSRWDHGLLLSVAGVCAVGMGPTYWESGFSVMLLGHLAMNIGLVLSTVLGLKQGVIYGSATKYDRSVDETSFRKAALGIVVMAVIMQLIFAVGAVMEKAKGPFHIPRDEKSVR
jgi:hypothetical protein